MRLGWLEIPAYRNLKGFRIDFDDSELITVLLGQNATGKSNLIEAIVGIFRELEMGSAPEFAYTMQYICQDHKILVDADPSRPTRRLGFTIDGSPISQAAFHENRNEYLPNNVFAYYSGWNGRLEKLFGEPTRQYYDTVLNSRDGSMPRRRRLFFCRKDYSQLVLLAFFLAEDDAARELLREKFRIQAFDSALFVLKRPYWIRGKPTKVQLSDGDSRFWYARGAFRGFLDRLWSLALAPIRHTEPVERDLRRPPEKTDRIFLYIKNLAQLHQLREGAEDSKDLFFYLESLFLCDLIDEVRVTVQLTDGSRVKFTQLSEGEQQLLTVLGLLLFTKSDESLYLLDEPDTHLNPVWNYEFLQLLLENAAPERGQMLVSSHNPLMIGGLKKTQVRLLRMAESRIESSEPEEDPIGIGVEGLLRSELFGLRSSLAPKVLADIDTENQLAGLEGRTEEQERQLEEATTRLHELGISRSHPNPLFEAFARALAREPLFQKPLLTKEELDEQDRLANEILDSLLPKT